jgi:hypothetical protein
VKNEEKKDLEKNIQMIINNKRDIKLSKRWVIISLLLFIKKVQFLFL